MKRKLTALVLISVMASALILGGCSNKTEESSTSKTESVTEEASSKAGSAAEEMAEEAASEVVSASEEAEE